MLKNQHAYQISTIADSSAVQEFTYCPKLLVVATLRIVRNVPKVMDMLLGDFLST